MNKFSFVQVLTYCWNIDCWRAGKTGAIVKRSSVHYTNDVDDLRKVMELCDIEMEIKS